LQQQAGAKDAKRNVDELEWGEGPNNPRKKRRNEGECGWMNRSWSGGKVSCREHHLVVCFEGERAVTTYSAGERSE
jgi:hypothetical protein